MEQILRRKWKVSVFLYGFIILISLIAAANVLNTISTGISLLIIPMQFDPGIVVLKSVGMTQKFMVKKRKVPSASHRHLLASKYPISVYVTRLALLFLVESDFWHLYKN